jgi:hypothetical protein
MKKVAFWDVTLCGSCKKRRFGGTYRLHPQVHKNRRARNNISSKWQAKHAAKREVTVLIVTAVKKLKYYIELSGCNL